MDRWRPYTESLFGGLVFDEIEEYDELIAYLTWYIDTGRAVGAAYHNRALAFAETGQIEKALQDFDSAIALLPKSHLPSMVKAKTLEMFRRFDEALETLDPAIAKRPNNASLRRTRGNILVKVGRLEEALHDLKRCVLLAPFFKPIREDRNWVVSKLKNDQPR